MIPDNEPTIETKLPVEQVETKLPVEHEIIESKSIDDQELVIYSDFSESEGASFVCLGDFKPLTVDDADTALVSGLISIQDYSRCLVSIEPLADTLKDLSLQIRKGATFELKKRGGRNAVKLLEQALDDGSEEVRLFAAEALEKLDSTYYKSINGLISKIRENPSRKLHFLLGRVYFDYAFKGMYDDGMREIYYTKALGEFNRALDVKVEKDEISNFQIWDFLGSVCYELGQHSEALEWFNRLVDEEGNSQFLLLRISAVYFALGKYDKVRKLCLQIKEEYGFGEYNELITSWLQ